MKILKIQVLEIYMSFFYVEYMYVVLLRGMHYEQFESAQTNQNPSANMR
jgi:hypothetical protein